MLNKITNINLNIKNKILREKGGRKKKAIRFKRGKLAKIGRPNSRIEMGRLELYNKRSTSEVSDFSGGFLTRNGRFELRRCLFSPILSEFLQKMNF